MKKFNSFYKHTKELFFYKKMSTHLFLPRYNPEQNSMESQKCIKELKVINLKRIYTD